MRQTQIFSSVFKTRSATLILLTNKLSRSPTSNRTKCRAQCTPSGSSNLRLPFFPSNRTHYSSAGLKWVKFLLKQVLSLVLSSRPLTFCPRLLGLLGQLIKQRLNSCTSCKKWASSWLVRDMSIKRPLRYPWKTTKPVLQWGSTNNLRQLALKCSELITCAILWQIMSTRQRWLTSRGPRNTPMHRMSKTFFQSGPIKEQVPLLRPAKFGNPHRLSHLDLSRLLLCSRLSKTSFTLHNLPRTSSSLPSLPKTSL